MVAVKICGLTREVDVAAAVSSGADAVGFIVGFPSSPRNLSLPRAGELIRGVPSSVDSVLVTTTDVLTREAEAVRRVGPSAIQLYGSPADPASLRKEFGVKLIRAYLMKSPTPEGARREAAGFDALLTDTYVAGSNGGTGRTSDWTVCREVRSAIEPVPLFLSGGLNPGNVALAIDQVRPFAVDISSGVESSPGVKDPSKVAEFMRLARGRNSR